MKYLCIILFFLIPAFSKVAAQITQKQINVFLNDTAVKTGHVGISIYEPATQKYLYNYNEDKNFTPSSNVKLFTTYAAMKYLGDSLVGLRYYSQKNTTVIIPTGDPTFLDPYFKNQKVFEFLKRQNNILLLEDKSENIWKEKCYGDGWSWDDYNEDYMTERSCFPIYKNMIRVDLFDNKFKIGFDNINFSQNNLTVTPSFFKAKIKNLDTIVDSHNFRIVRELGKNTFTIVGDNTKFESQEIPFQTGAYTTFALLQDTLIKIDSLKSRSFKFGYFANAKMETPQLSAIRSQPTDSLLRPMMHNSDNFFAEQTLLMVSNEKLGYMNDEKIIDTLLKTDFKDLPTKPRWVDGSGLSRYNLFSPKDFVFLLDKMKTEFGIERIKSILPTVGQGTLKGYNEKAAGAIYAKTGSMSNNVSLSGYLFTKKNKMLIFSVLINNFSGTGVAGRRAIEKMLQEIKNNN